MMEDHSLSYAPVACGIEAGTSVIMLVMPAASSSGRKATAPATILDHCLSADQYELHGRHLYRLAALRRLVRAATAGSDVMGGADPAQMARLRRMWPRRG